jgi:hypothetical protein
MSENSGAYAEITVQFGSDTAIQTFPYLGQATFMGHIDALLAGGRAMTPRRFMAVCESPEVRAYMDAALEEGKLAEKSGKPFPFEISEMGFDTMDGLRMCGAIKGELAGPKAEISGLKPIALELAQELDDLIILLGGAADRDLQFNFKLQECENPPEKLKEWLAAESADTWNWVSKIVDDVEKGIAANHG